MSEIKASIISRTQSEADLHHVRHKLSTISADVLPATISGDNEGNAGGEEGDHKQLSKQVRRTIRGPSAIWLENNI